MHSHHGQDMSELDGDDGILRDSEGNKATRDIVQFVPFSKYPPVSEAKDPRTRPCAVHETRLVPLLLFWFPLTTDSLFPFAEMVDLFLDGS